MAVTKLFDLNEHVYGKEFILDDRLQKAKTLLKKFAKKYPRMKMFISGSYLFKKKYMDIDLFIISPHKKEDYRNGLVHINFLPLDIEQTLFFHSAKSVSVMNFATTQKMTQQPLLEEILGLYELVILLCLQKQPFIQPLREFILKMEYLLHRVIFNPFQLSMAINALNKERNLVLKLSKYTSVNISNFHSKAILRKTLDRFIEKNRHPEKGKLVYQNWNIYNQTYQEALDLVN